MQKIPRIIHCFRQNDTRRLLLGYIIEKVFYKFSRSAPRSAAQGGSFMRLFGGFSFRKSSLTPFGISALLGILLLGGCGFQKKETPGPERDEPSSLVAVPVHPETSIPGKVKAPSGKVLRPLAPPTPTIEPIRGMGTGSPFSSRDIPGGNPSLQELARGLNHPVFPKEKTLFTSRDLGILGEMADSVQDFRDSLEDSALEGGSKTLNALPFVYAEPDEATVDYSGGTLTIGISVPVERFRIGKPLAPEVPKQSPSPPPEKP